MADHKMYNLILGLYNKTKSGGVAGQEALTKSLSRPSRITLLVYPALNHQTEPLATRTFT